MLFFYFVFESVKRENSKTESHVSPRYKPLDTRVERISHLYAALSRSQIFDFGSAPVDGLGCDLHGAFRFLVFFSVCAEWVARRCRDDACPPTLRVYDNMIIIRQTGDGGKSTDLTADACRRHDHSESAAARCLKAGPYVMRFTTRRFCRGVKIVCCRPR